ncbi:MAG TPA: hypothetical protein VM925_24795 [Labilithrix sp.]|jgi:hypothetical protein|nr:hypothetical protein [Labilithrix sp.]
MDGPKRRKLLVASVGIASISYVLACSKSQQPVTGNLPAPPPTETTPISGNLPAPEPMDAAPPLERDSGPGPSVISGNLPAPPPPDGGPKRPTRKTDGGK